MCPVCIILEIYLQLYIYRKILDSVIELLEKYIPILKRRDRYNQIYAYIKFMNVARFIRDELKSWKFGAPRNSF